MDRHRWEPGERETVLADVAEQKAEREASGEQWPHTDVIKARAIETPQPKAVRMSSTRAWAQWVDGRIKGSRVASEASVAGAVADVLAPIEKEHKAALDELRAEVAALKSELSELRAEAKVRSAIDDVQARLAKLETPTRLRASG